MRGPAQWFVLLVVPFLHSLRIKPTLVFVDPLNEFGNAEQVFKICSERGIDCLTLWSPVISKKILAFNGGTMTNLEIGEIEASTYKGNPEEWASLNRRDCKEDISSFANSLVGVVSESDTGLRVAEELSACLNLFSSNGINEGRRDKYMMQQRLAGATLRGNQQINSMRQVLTDDWEEVETFLLSLPCPFPCVIKPSRGSGSKDVIKVADWVKAKEVFTAMLGSPGFANGTISDAVLVQEWVAGTEYVLDTVTRGGEHKVVALWKYDKRPANGAPFVYYSTEIMQINGSKQVKNNSNNNDSISASTNSNNSDINGNSNSDDKRFSGEISYNTDSVGKWVDPSTSDELVAAIVEYGMHVLNSLDVRWGPCHIEVILKEKDTVRAFNEVVLVEANVGRFHGQDFIELCSAAYGYNAVDVTIDALLSGWQNHHNGLDIDSTDTDSGAGSDDSLRYGTDSDKENNANKESGANSRWTRIPRHPAVTRCAGRIVNLVSYKQGILTRLLPSHEVYALPSMQKWMVTVEEGDYVEKTVDLSTALGYALLLHEDPRTVEEDYKTLVERQRNMLTVDSD